MRKRQSRGNMGSAIIRFFMGICFLLILFFFGYYLLAIKDYSYLLDDPSVSLRSFVSANPTVAVSATEAIYDPEAKPTTPAPAIPGASPALSTATPVPGATPTSIPTPTPVPTPTPAPTPIPTPIPEIDLASSRTKGFTVPPASTDGDIGISKCYVSVPDSYQIMQLEGWGYVQQPYFNGRDCTTYLIIQQESSDKQIAYLTTSIAGVSNRSHTSVCTEPDASDFRVNISVKNYPDGVYNMGLVLAYKKDGKAQYSYYPFDSSYSFTVLSGEIISPVKLTPNITE